MRPFYTWILSPWFMTHRSPLKEPVQFIPDRFQILTWVSQQRHHAVAQADITQRPIDTGFSLRLSLLVAFVQGRLRTFRQDTFKRCQKDHRIEVLLDGVLAQATETFDFKDILEPVVVGLVAPAPAIDLIELCCRILSLIPQRGQQDFGFTRREREFHQAYLHIHRQLMLFDKGARGGSGRTRQGHDRSARQMQLRSNQRRADPAPEHRLVWSAPKDQTGTASRRRSAQVWRLAPDRCADRKGQRSKLAQSLCRFSDHAGRCRHFATPAFRAALRTSHPRRVADGRAKWRRFLLDQRVDKNPSPWWWSALQTTLGRVSAAPESKRSQSARDATCPTRQRLC